MRMGFRAWLALAWTAAAVGLVGCGSAPAAPQAPTPPTSTSATAPRTATAASAATPVAGRVVNEAMTIETGKMLHKPNWPRYTHATWTVRAGDTVVLTILSYDAGTAPLPGASPYGKVVGTVGGTELVDGKAVASVPDQEVAHTFTVPGLGLNLVVPAAPKGGTVTVQATFRVAKAGVYNWQCEAPCGTTASGWGGPMLTPKWMQGTVTVQA